MMPNAQTIVVLAQLAGWVRMRADGHRGGERGDEAEIILREIDRLSRESADDDDLDRRIADARPRHAGELLSERIAADANAPTLREHVPTATAEERIRRATVLMVAKVIRGVVDAASARAANASIVTAECDAAVLVALQRFCSDCDVDEIGAREFITDMFVAACSDVGFVMLRWGE